MDKQDDARDADHLQDMESVATAHRASVIGAPSSSLVTASHAAASSIVSVGGPSISFDAGAIAPPASSTHVASPRPLSISIGSDAFANAGGALLMPSAVGRHNEFLRTYKVLIVGEAGVGKSNLMHRYCYNEYDPALPSTIGVEFCSREVGIPSGPVGVTETVVLQLWDTAGQERNAGVISNAFYRNAVGAIIVYDVTRHESLLSVPRWAAQVTQLARDNCVCVVVGAKLDLLDANAAATSTTAGSLEALQQEADRISHAMGMRNFMTSALSGKGVLEAFTHLILAVDAVQAASLHNNGIFSGRYQTRCSSHVSGASVREAQMQTAAAVASASSADLTDGAEGRRGWPDGDGASLPLSRVVSTPLVSGYTGASPSAGRLQRQPSSHAKKTLDLRGFGSSEAGSGAYEASPACSGGWGC
ncbi:guanine nucleotide-binding protein-like protein [Leishmania infantum JPCM5]|uniref:Guanine_nucleotide-binding_protein-like_protein n=2 Tax=Leishmania infantum TaxID=5671 RepID=A0A6L0WUK7_LEIIN|nr:guanine nucleotide-binding protein-like protein [Leishmania infantum JPCM5]CAC9469094.1 guanine_nucleotide-binding_protein-like_protein [Leishmania infantum]CAM66640.2 guanine nucleotide-binding protein-like protein [Leishmania infantum JPCM5]SUZ40310.1 guanine_nucleotide-binding_protein-like_protein [Leishmania infantum]|eukprot:XP_001464261.2 guanine nucleotide-binding protein-like protein [Leishmania infantum JPCM5]